MKLNARSIVALSVASALVLGITIFSAKHKQGAQNEQASNAGAATAQDAAANTKGSSRELTHPELSHAQSQKAGQTTSASSSSSQASPQAKDAAVAALPNAVPAAPAQPEQTCFVETFHHKPMSGHSDEEACSRHKNLIKLTHSSVNPTHFCVRVNGTPVKYERKGDEILVGSIAGPKAKISVSYCTKKSDCAELAKDDCTVPKDEFMEALGGDAADVGVQWDNDSAQGAENAKLNAEVKKELSEIDDMNASESDRAPAQAAVFKEWIRDEAATACGKKPQS